MQRFDFQVPIVVPLNQMNTFRNLLLSGRLNEFPNPFKRTTTFNELKIRYSNYCQSKNLAFHDPRPLETDIEARTDLGGQWGLPSNSRIIIRARENGIITIHSIYSFRRSLPLVEIRNLMKKNERVLPKIAKWFVDYLKGKIAEERGDLDQFIAIGPVLTFIFIQERATIRKRRKYVEKISKFSGVYRPLFKGEYSIEDDEFSVSGKSFHLFWTQHHIRKKTRNKLLAGQVETISLANGINEFLKHYTLPTYFSMATDLSWEIFLNFLNPFVLAGKAVQTPLLPANWRSWLIHCSKIYKLRESYRSLLIHLISQNQIPITDVTSVYRSLQKIVSLTPKINKQMECGLDVNNLTSREKFVFSTLLLSQRIADEATCQTPSKLDLYTSHTLSAIYEWVNFLKGNVDLLFESIPSDLLISDLIFQLKELLVERKRLKMKYGHLQAENSVFDPFSYESLRVTLENLVSKGILEASSFKGRGRGKNKKKYAISRNLTQINDTILSLIDQTFPLTILFKEEEIKGVPFKVLV